MSNPPIFTRVVVTVLETPDFLLPISVILIPTNHSPEKAELQKIKYKVLSRGGGGKAGFVGMEHEIVLMDGQIPGILISLF